MKLKTLVLTLTVALFSASSFAQWFPATVQVTVLPGVVTAQVTNPYLQPVVCSGQVFGQTFQGPVFTTYFLEQIMPIGSFRYAYVQTNPYAPFVNGWANIVCRYIW